MTLGWLCLGLFKVRQLLMKDIFRKEVLPPVWATIKLLVKEARRQDSLTIRF